MRREEGKRERVLRANFDGNSEGYSVTVKFEIRGYS